MSTGHEGPRGDRCTHVEQTSRAGVVEQSSRADVVEWTGVDECAGMDDRADCADEVRRQWEAIFPDLDTSMVAVMGRIARIAQVVQARSDTVLAAQGITRAEFDVISLLARHGGTLSPTRVSTELIISGAGVTKRLKRLSSAGLVSRIPDPADGRGSLVQLTGQAWDLLRPILESVLGFEGRLLADLEPAATDRLATDLRELLLSIEADTAES